MNVHTPTTAISPLLLDSSRISNERKDRLRELNHKENALIASLPSDDPNDPKRRKRVLATWPEIEGQSKSMTSSLSRNEVGIQIAAERIATGNYTRLYLTGCGDSLACHIALKHLIETVTHLSANPVQALEFAYYPPAGLDETCIVICLSSSGTTPRTVEALYAAQSAGALTIALTNTEGSALDADADISFILDATRVGWPTQSSTSAMALVARLALEIGLRSAERKARSKELLAELDRIPQLIDSIISENRDKTAAIAQTLAPPPYKDRVKGNPVPTVHFTAGGPALASAIFGAAKIRECTSYHAQSIGIEEFHHYTSVKPGESLFIIAPDGPSRARALDTARHAEFWGAKAYGIAMEGDDLLSANCEQIVHVPRVDELLAAFVCTIPLQMMAVQVAQTEFDVADADS
jgi:glucosamine--fructose-6-phosphate aminotransferase (isomerizing)